MMLVNNEVGVYRNACQAVMALAPKPEYQAIMREHHGVMALARCMDLSDRGVVSCAAKALLCFVSNVDERRLAAVVKSADFATPLVALIELGDRFMVRKAAQTLGVLSRDAYARKDLKDANIVTTIVKVLADSSDSDTLISSCNCLGNMCVNDRARRAVVMMERGLPSVIELLRHQDARVQAEAAFVVSNLVLTDENRIAYCRLRSSDPARHHPLTPLCRYLKSVGLPPLIALLSLMDQDCVRAAASAIKAYSATDVGRDALLDAGALPQLVAQLENTDPVTLALSARAIGNVAYKPDIDEAIADLKGVQLLAALLGHKTVSVVNSALRALASVTKRSATNRATLVEMGVLGQLVRQVKAGERSAQLEAMRCLVHIALSKGLQDALLSASVPALAVSVIADQKAASALQLQAVVLVANMAKSHKVTTLAAFRTHAVTPALSATAQNAGAHIEDALVKAVSDASFHLAFDEQMYGEIKADSELLTRFRDWSKGKTTPGKEAAVRVVQKIMTDPKAISE